MSEELQIEESENSNHYPVTIWVEESVQIKVPLSEANSQEEAEGIIETILDEHEDSYDEVLNRYDSQKVARKAELLPVEGSIVISEEELLIE